MNLPISQAYRDLIKEMITKARHPLEIDENSVWQEANKATRPYINKMLSELLEEGSRIEGIENLKQLYKQSKEGKSCLLLVEHYSNFDLPTLIYLLENMGEEGQEIADHIIAIAGLKLNEHNELVKAFTEAYSRIVIYPSRSLAKMDEETLRKEFPKSKAINRAAMHMLIEKKHSGNIILVFPSGTRYRPGKPETKKGVKEIDSYLKSFDLVCFVGIAGNILRINPDEHKMEDDIVCKDKIIFLVDTPQSAKDFREKAKESCPEGTDKKQWVADRIMEKLESLHTKAEELRKE
ncbi:1-acyl-sn-glycerol-3-phosphate acyltransferase [Spirochaetia bacterium 38H-sp]|uniref:1-acyl-sn-glycerol-3-phosphate acyltransferase n=1 Tax=Rarispira pelagica TaxID=3141764 RepID=A0ABU9UA73_9SPIR